MTSSPKPLNRNPPPLDLGEASLPKDSHMPTRSGGADDNRIRKGVTFPASDQTHSPPSPSSAEGSRHRSSDEGAATSDSGQPLTSPGPSKSRRSPKLGKSPRCAQSPRVYNGSIKQSSLKAMSSPQIGRRSIRECDGDH